MDSIQIDGLLRRVDALPTLNSRYDDEILGYDPRGPEPFAARGQDSITTDIDVLPAR